VRIEERYHRYPRLITAAIAWLSALLVVLAILKKMFRTVTVILALCATIVLLHFTLPEAGQNIELRQLIGLFVGGAFIVSVSLYMIFIRAD